MPNDTTPPESVKTELRVLKPEFSQPGPIEWLKLCSSLVAAQRDRAAGVEYENASPGFAAAEEALGAICTYLGEVPGLLATGAHLPLLDLLEALRDLDEGRKPPLLATRSARGRMSTPHRRSSMIGLAARCMSELVDSGATVPEAAKKVCKALDKGKALGWKTTTPAKIKNWRSRCQEGQGADIAPEALRRYREALPPGMGDTPALRAENLLRILSEAKRRGLGE